MKTRLGWFAVLAVLALAPSTAEAQRHRSGNVNTPYGTFSMQEMLAAGGDPSAAQENRAERLMMQQQQQYMTQLAKQQKAYQDYLKKHPEAAKAARAASPSLTPTRAAKKAKSKSSKDASTKAATTTPAKAVAGAPPAVKASDPD